MKCPICQRELDPADKSVEPFRPFCSSRCKLIDLGRWLGGKYQIPVREQDSDDVAPGAENRPRTPDDDDNPGA